VTAGRKKAEPLVPDSSAFEVEMAIEKLKNTSPGVDQMTAELFEACRRTIRSDIRKLSNSL